MSHVDVSSYRQYRELVDQLCQQQSSTKVFNNIPVHSQILLTRLFEQANERVEIFSGELNEYVYGSPDVCEAAIKFLSRGGSLDILVERTPASFLNHPLIKACQANPYDDFTLHQWDTSKEPKLPDSHFVVVDGKAWSFRLDKAGPLRQGCFNDPTVGKTLHESFASMFAKYSKPLQLVP